MAFGITGFNGRGMNWLERGIEMPVSLINKMCTCVAVLTGYGHSCTCKLSEYSLLGVITLKGEKIKGMFQRSSPIIT